MEAGDKCTIHWGDMHNYKSKTKWTQNKWAIVVECLFKLEYLHSAASKSWLSNNINMVKNVITQVVKEGWLLNYSSITTVTLVQKKCIKIIILVMFG